MATKALATEVIPPAEGIVLRKRGNQAHFQQWLDRGVIRGSGGFRKALRQFSEAVERGNWEAVKLAIEYAIGKPNQFLASKQYDDDGSLSIEATIEDVEQTVSETRRTRTVKTAGSA